MELFSAFLAQHDDGAWLRAVDRLARTIHPVDRVATRVWFHFYPLALDRLMAAPGAAARARRMTLSGNWRLADQIDTSHHFLYGHQYWPLVKRAVFDFARSTHTPGSLDLAAQTQEVAEHAARGSKVPAAVLMGIAAVALRTLQQVGAQAFAMSPGTVVHAGAWHGRSADDVLRARERQDSQGALGFLRGARKQWTVIFDERDRDARFPLVSTQYITTAAALDTRDYRAADPRCSQGPIPVHCQSCSCGTCWVGVIGGADRLSPVEPAERAKLAECGYIETDESHPPVRLACQAQAHGRVALVIPPWNGVLARASRTT